MSNAENSTLFGGKPFPNWQSGDFSLPGYQNARLVARTLGGSKDRVSEWGFMVSPNSFTVQRSNDLQTSRTSAGWFMSRGGEALGNLSFSGYMLDTLQVPERRRFWEWYDKYVSDYQNNYMEFISNYTLALCIEGYWYYGLIQNVSMTKNGQQPYAYQYNVNFVFYKMESAYSISSRSMSEGNMKKQMGLNKSATYRNESVESKSQLTTQLSANVANILLR